MGPQLGRKNTLRARKGRRFRLANQGHLLLPGTLLD